jgi:hypothetical protein
MFDQDPEITDDFPPAKRKMSQRESERLYQTILANLEVLITDLKSKFKNEDAFNQFLDMLHASNSGPRH